MFSSIFNTISLLLEYPFNYNETPNIFSKYKLKIEEIFKKNNDNNNNIITNNQVYNNEINNSI